MSLQQKLTPYSTLADLSTLENILQRMMQVMKSQLQVMGMKLVTKQTMKVLPQVANKSISIP